MAESGKVTDLHKLKVAELKKLLKDKGLPVAGNKPELVERLLNTGDASLNASDIDKDVEPEDDSMLDESLDPISTEPSSPSSVPGPTATPSSSSTEVVKPVAAAVSTSGDKTQIAAPTSTDASGIAARLKRFGVVSDQAKKAARQERFQTSDTKSSSSGKLSSSTPAATADTLKKRAERFGVTAATGGTTASDSSAVKAGGDVDTLKKRAERFGQVTATKLAKVEEQGRVLKRKERFGAITAPGATKVAVTADVSEAKKKRLERFGAAAVAV